MQGSGCRHPVRGFRYHETSSQWLRQLLGQSIVKKVVTMLALQICLHKSSGGETFMAEGSLSGVFCELLKGGLIVGAVMLPDSIDANSRAYW